MIKAVLIGAGQRGTEVYGQYALDHPEQISFIAIAEPDPTRRDNFSSAHNIIPDYQFNSWEGLLSKSIPAQAAIICTPDHLHTKPTIAMLEMGIDVLLEKPMAPTVQECQKMIAIAEKLGRQLHICHVLRYTRHFQTMKDIISSGDLGQIINISHRENVSYWHMAHSFVRGNWSHRAKSSPMILTKCCHDLDLITWMLQSRCESLSSFGSLIHFRVANAPDGAPSYCLDGCPVEESCL